VSRLRPPLGKGSRRESGEDAGKPHPRGGRTVCQRGESLGGGYVQVAGARGVLALRQAAERQSIPINNRSARGGWAPSFCANAGASIGGHAAIRFTEAVRPAAKTRQPDAGHRSAARGLSVCRERGLAAIPEAGNGREYGKDHKNSRIARP
jgi:hypothetical protein